MPEPEKPVLSPTPSPAPSEVPTLRLHSSSGSSLTLSWAPPERPNGVILDYEMKYFEKVRAPRGRKKPWARRPPQIVSEAPGREALGTEEAGQGPRDVRTH